ncbi:8625_t:CDS:1, partial [Scutellospora calospora]
KQKSKPLTLTFRRQESSSSLASLASTSELNILNPTTSGGRQLSAVWEFFDRQKTKSSGHFSAKCKYCSAKWARGNPSRLEAHLALQCSKVDDHVRQIYLLRMARYDNYEEEMQSENSTVTKKRKSNNGQSILSNYFLQSLENSLSERQINSINSSLLKAFVVCGIPFSVIENLFFIDFLQNLCPNYSPPSSETLSGRLLDQESSKVTIKHETILNKSNNLTL